ncbi:MAG: hypothetical protein IPL39_13525 [Opitutaceae bacterium]|nr:hypothetical protein [Opitutaceae bacterium]
MDELPPALRRLVEDGQLPHSQVSARFRSQLQPLIDGGILQSSDVGRGSVLTVRHPDELRDWVAQCFPSFAGAIVPPPGANRAAAIALRRDSKATGEGVKQSLLLLRAWAGTNVEIDGKPFEVAALTRAHGVAATTISDNTSLNLNGSPALLIENLECFLAAEDLGTGAACALYSGGRVSERLINCLARSEYGSAPLLHLPDYDPVGLDDYLRLQRQLGPRIRLFLPSDFVQRFERFSASSLITEKRRNRLLLERFMSERPNPTDWPCPESALVFTQIRHHGAGLEQESLFLPSDRHKPVAYPRCGAPVGGRDYVELARSQRSR